MAKINPNTRKLVLAALFVALDIIVTRFCSITVSANMRIGLQAAVFGLGGFFLGPWFAGVAFLASDIIGFIVNSAGYAFNPFMSIVPVLSGISFGFLLHNKPVNLVRTIVAYAIHTLIINLVIRTATLSYFYGSPFLETMISRLATVPLNGIASCIVAFALMKVLPEKIRTFTTVRAVNE